MNSPLARWLLDIDSIPADADPLRLAWEHPLPGWLWMLIIVVLAALSFWSYSRLVAPRPARAVLAVLRFALLMLVLVLLCGPMLEHPRETIEEDWVLVLADRSRSMEIADADAPDGGRLSRNDQLREALEGQSVMWQRLADQRELVWLGFHVGAFNLTPSAEAVDPTDLGAAPRLPVELGPSGGEQTSLESSLQQALQQAAARPLSGVVVLSDGRTTDPPGRALIRRLQADAVPVFTVPLGSPEPVGDVAIHRVEAPRRAFIRDKVPVVVELDQLGDADRSAPLVVRLIDQETGEVLDSVELAAGEDTDRVTLTAEPSLAGSASWEVVVETARPDLIPDNNAKPFDIELIDRPLRVLYVEGYPRWEYRYLKNLLVREKTIESSVMLLSADRDFAQEGNQAITRLPRSPEEFAQFDVIILGDVPATFFSLEQLEMIRGQIAERGTGLLWVGGERNTPRTYTGSVLADLLPMRGPLALSTIGQPVNLEPTPLAERLGVMRLSVRGEDGWPVDLVAERFGWSQLAWVQRIEPGRLKPTAEVLAESVQDLGEGPLPIVVHMRYGAGQSIYVATDEVWRWRYGRGEPLFEQFWIQMIRMLGRETLISTGQRFTLEVAPRRVAVGQPVHIDLKLLDAQLAETRRHSVPAIIEGPDGETITELELRRLDGDQERYAATYIPAVPGSIRVRLDDPVFAGLDAEAVIEVFTPEDELRRPETDHPLLSELARATGGSTLAPDRLGELEALLPNRSVQTVNPLSERIWDTPLLFGLILLLATAEWIGRKAARLV
ncbi:MAG: hypothetical protein ACYTJ0_01280 [Planctomycetota bacterium]|jgi:hypothetical protein